MSKRNIVENNNNFTDFSQVWSKYIFTDDIPDTPLSLEKASSVVTKDNPANVVAVGNPCKVLREINEHDKEFYYRVK